MEKKRRKTEPELDSRPIRHREIGSYQARRRPAGSYSEGSRQRSAGSYSEGSRQRAAGPYSDEARRRSAARRQARLRKKRRQRIALAAALALLVIAAAVGLYFLLRPKEELPPVDFSHAGDGTAGATQEADTEAPVITGVQDQTVEVGDAISYKSGVTVTDNVDANVALQVDASQVDLETPGAYTVTYTAVDAAGNEAEPVTATITVVEPDPGAANEEEMMAMAQSILDEILTDGMTQMEQAKAIYDWCHYKISYVDSSDKSSWINGAIQAFETRSGDCFNYFAAAKALLTAAGIENMDVVKSDTSHSSHYWSLVDCGDGWYHFDTTPRKGDGDYFFMVTDAQLEEYSEAHNNSHIFDHSLYPATNTEEITDLHALD